MLLLAPLGGIVWSALKGGLGSVTDTLTSPDALHAFYLSLLIAGITVVVTTVFGVIVALVLARDQFPGKRVLSALVDLPLGVSPVIVGLMAVLLFGRGGWFESFFRSQGIQIIFALPSMVIVTIFISIPFVIREIVPLLQELGMEEEQAAWTLGASRLQTFFRVTLPNIRWGLLYGIAHCGLSAIATRNSRFAPSRLPRPASVMPSVFRAMASRECATAFAILRKPAPADRLLETIRAAVKESQT